MKGRTVRCRKTGSAIAEFGPAMFVLVIIVFFPLLDFLGMAAQYGMAAYVNYAMSRELACRSVADGTGGSPPAVGTTTPVMAAVNGNQVYTDIVTNGIAATGFGSFLGINNGTLTCQAGYTNPSDGTQPTVTCSTVIAAAPFVSVPWFSATPGLNAPFNIQIQSVRPREVLQ